MFIIQAVKKCSCEVFKLKIKFEVMLLLNIVSCNAYTAWDIKKKTNLSLHSMCLCEFNFGFCLIGMSHEGIFRISGNHKVVESLKATYDKGMLL